jgi:hypothetical protein
MLPKEFAPGILEPSFASKAALYTMLIGGVFLLFALENVGVLGLICAILSISVVTTTAMFFLIKAERHRLMKSGKHSCAPLTDRIFLRADLTAAQREGIRP